MEYAKYIQVSDKVVNMAKVMGIQPIGGSLNLEDLLIGLLKEGNGSFEERLSKLQASDIPANARGHGESLVANKVRDRRFTYSVSRAPNGTIVGYDMGAFKSALPQDMALRTVRIEAKTAGGQRSTSALVSGSFEAPSLPVYLLFEVLIQTPSGIIEMGSQIVATDEVSGTAILKVTNQPPGASILTVSQFLEALSGEFWNISQRVQELEASGLVIGQAKQRASLQMADDDFQKYKKVMGEKVDALATQLDSLKKKFYVLER